MARDEQEMVPPLVVEAMQKTMPMELPFVVDTDMGENWLEAG